MSHSTAFAPVDAGTIHKVVVGFDDSPPAHAALGWAIEEAQAWRTPLRVVVATSKMRSLSADAEVLYGRWMEEAAAHAEEILRRSPLNAWEVAMAPGRAQDVLASGARADAITVVGSVGHGVVAGSLLGSVSRHLVAHSAGPVVVCGRGVGRPDGPVVVGVDGSPRSERALDFALARSEYASHPVQALFAWEGAERPGTPLAGGPLPALANEYLDAERWLSEALAGRTTDHPATIIEPVLASISPRQALTDASSMASLVVVGTRGRSALEGALLGSVSLALLRHGHCPVAVVP
jgi:nucleotide-binding universal stress UspA family protein